VGDSLTFDTTANAAGSHQLVFRYANATGGTATRTVYVDGSSVGTLSLPSLANWDTWGTATLTATLTAGRHSVKISFDSGNTAAINLDNLTVARP
ncbi:MAG: carbohydrate-binding protein, partial [Nakamurella sp.]